MTRLFEKTIAVDTKKTRVSQTLTALISEMESERPDLTFINVKISVDVRDGDGDVRTYIFIPAHMAKIQSLIMLQREEYQEIDDDDIDLYIEKNFDPIIANGDLFYMVCVYQSTFL